MYLIKGISISVDVYIVYNVRFFLYYYSPADIILKELTKILPSQKDFQEKLNRTRK